MKLGDFKQLVEFSQKAVDGTFEYNIKRQIRDRLLELQPAVYAVVEAAYSLREAIATGDGRKIIEGEATLWDALDKVVDSEIST